MTILYFIVIFSVLVFVHEFGHFIAAKKQGITVHEFGFGFPPKLFSFLWRGTRYSLNLLPLGGFVRIKGEEGEEANAPDSFAQRSIARRSAVIGAGVFMNVLLGWLLLTIGFLVGFPQIIDASIPDRYVQDRSIIVQTVLPDAPATTVDIRVGDRITAIDGMALSRIEDLQKALADRDGKETIFRLERNTQILERTITPRYIPKAERVAIGVGLDEIGTVRYPLLQGVWKGTITTGVVLRETVIGFWRLLRDLVVSQRVSIDVSGPIGIAVITGEIARRGFSHLLQFTAILSLNLAVINVLPIPALDGGRLLFLAIERMRQKSIAKETEAIVHRIGFVLLILLVILVTYKDIMNLFFS